MLCSNFMNTARLSHHAGRRLRTVWAAYLNSSYNDNKTHILRNTRHASTFRVNQTRLMQNIHHTSKWGTGERWGNGPTETGMSRLSLSDADKNVRDWFADETQSLGCTLTIDEMGNMFAVRPGKQKGDPTFAGSHLDTQPTGGRYDGVLGVISALEILHVLQENDVETNFPVGVVNWTNEEGARFPKSMIASGVWAHDIPLQEAHNLGSVIRGENATMRSELERIGYLGQTRCSFEAMSMAAHFELHIEQGPILEKENQKIGVVEGAQAYRWFTITVKGRDCHTGTTPFMARADPLLAAAKMIADSREIAHEMNALASTGIIEAYPGAINTVPGRVTFTLDIRGSTDEKIAALEEALRTRFQEIADGKPTLKYKDTANRDICNVEWRTDFKSAAVHFNEDCIKCVQDAADAALQEQGSNLTRRMVSGAGHDSVYTNRHVPTSMIFVPSRAGISHNPSEFTSPEDCALGAEVLLAAVLNFDALRS